MNKKASLLWFIVIMVVFLLTACSRGEADKTAIKSVKYDTESGKIKINATMDKDTLRKYKHKTIYLIEVTAGNDSDDISTLIPISRAKADDKMNFSLPLKDGARTILYSGFVLAAFDNEKGYTALGDVHYIDNPEALAKNTEEYPEYASIKGLYIVSSSDATSLGASHTTIRIPIEEYILPESKENAITFIFDGESHYYDAEKMAELDYKIKNLTGAGIEVFLEFTLDTPKKELPSALSCLAASTGVTADSDRKEENHYAISVSTGEAYRHMAAFFEFFAERYTRQDKKYGFAASYIIGHGVNSTLDTNIDDERTLSESTERYGELLRIAHTALRSKYSCGKVFISLDNKWTLDLANEEGQETDEPLPSPRRHIFGGAEFINSLKNTLCGADIDFGVAIIPTSSDDSSMVWANMGATNSADTEFVTMKNISVVRDLIGEETELLIYNYGISSSDESSQAASYAYAYMKAIEADVTAFIYNGHWDGATGNGETGLWRVGTDGGASEKREIYKVFEEIDVKGIAEPEPAKLRIGSEWRELWEKNSKSAKVVSRSDSAGTTVFGGGKKGKTETSVLFDFSDGKNHNFFPSDSSYYVEICDYLGEKALKSGLLPKYLGENMGVRSAPVSFETLRGVETITVVLNVESKIGNTSEVTLALSQSGADAKVFHTSSVTVQSSNRQTVYFDVSDADLSNDNGDVVLYFWVKSNLSRSPVYSSQEGTAEGEVSLYIEDISVTLKKGGIGVVWIIIIIVILLILAFGAYLFIRYYFLCKQPKQQITHPARYSQNARINNNGQRPRQVAPRSYEERRYYEQLRARQQLGHMGGQPRIRPNSDNIDHRRR
ncbi:MAG: hypothetical protein IKT56_04050 [Clostridia bacterium]|nr:hypothetical protein [Clostridia bacterium]